MLWGYFSAARPRGQGWAAGSTSQCGSCCRETSLICLGCAEPHPQHHIMHFCCLLASSLVMGSFWWSQVKESGEKASWRICIKAWPKRSADSSVCGSVHDVALNLMRKNHGYVFKQCLIFLGLYTCKRTTRENHGKLGNKCLWQQISYSELIYVNAWLESDENMSSLPWRVDPEFRH